MLSLHTNASALTIQKNLANTQSALSTSMTRLGTGYRINSAKDDAAGLQIATRLQAQTSGMKVAMQNTQNATSMLQTAEGAFNEVTNILYRMKDLATQAADGSSTQADVDALQAEYDALGKELANIVKNTSYGGEKLFDTAGKLTAAITFQIGATSDETMDVDVSTELTGVKTSFGAISASYTSGIAGTELTDDANGQIDLINDALASVGGIRSALGAVQNRLEHTFNNLANMVGNTTDATGRIMDVDYASESANMSSQQILLQASTAMLKQASSMNQMVLSLIQ
ncbi:Lateral flagellin [Dyella sp. M7H15-1]|uniref:flagellin N-terminal helical domain-containing protein n=1 Tax=Dyella sp. M7H15-1 TaxID=2501295 RepID=UPI00100515A8|nr:flagellin [Dyella sp. M7H15-1]QAU24286.1 Lateral flagellin [Dyella sp. M7H15-1]